MNLHGIVTKAINYGEKDRILTIITFEKGKILIHAKGVRAENAKLKSAAMPLVFGEFSIAEGKRNILTNVSVEENFYNCWTDAEKNISSLFVLELLEKTAMINQEISKELILALKAINEINYSQGYPIAIVVWYYFNISEYIGINFLEENIPRNIKEHIQEFAYIDCENVLTMDLVIDEINSILEYMIILLKENFSININMYRQLRNRNNFQCK